MKFCRFLPLSTPVGRTHAPVYGLLAADAVREIVGVPWGGWVEGHTIWDLSNSFNALPLTEMDVD